jgi:hypothetical protein
MRLSASFIATRSALWRRMAASSDMAKYKEVIDKAGISTP